MSSSKKIPSFEQLSRAILPLGKPLHKLTLVFGECQVKVSSNSAKLDSVLRHYFYEFVKPTESYNFEVICIEADPMQLELPFRLKDPSPGKAKVKEEYCDLPGGRVVKKRLTGLNLLMGDNGQNIAFGPCEDNDNQVINFINSRYLEWLLKEPSVLGHAAGVRFMNQGFAFAGIANPDSFRQTLRQEGFFLAGFKEFKDHYGYTAQDVAALVAAALAQGAKALLTTEKDFVKLRPFFEEFPILALTIELRMNQGFDLFIAERIGTEA